MKFSSGKIAKMAGVLGLTVAALTATPASAGTAATASCTRHWQQSTVQVQVDNCSDGWVWVWVGDNWDWATVYAKDNFDNPHELSTTKGKSSAAKFLQVKSFHICVGKSIGWFPPLPYKQCGAEIYV